MKDIFKPKLPAVVMHDKTTHQVCRALHETARAYKRAHPCAQVADFAPQNSPQLFSGVLFFTASTNVLQLSMTYLVSGSVVIPCYALSKLRLSNRM
ncbi:hypothetical protein VFPPC_18712 [Pochonia chlamydosporia 170]|uniref:Uncharacterized protein n=1 Tax=Pochonia chlamydosporia 170 TaxID=1380566 RepID=A0A219AS20_METCM|nr:hypothetical protein VFPPC_18712 [Pochonia chlamydosporia 170]OWT43561.1 hypothetical protein VFPPC_18712 [Pochonia chlamydosporia 170]